MRSSRLYYELKPYLPWRLRLALRRALARRKRESHKHVWPINEAAGQVPAGWTGWPEGKRFAFVLTHDVEGQKGLDRCLQLAELDASFGFRSSFNFIPEGDYSDSFAVREGLSRKGFEVGVHDLRHDGFLYQSRASFRGQAQEINKYLRRWDAKGFRSAFMHHRLEWYDDLDVEYDASTFDTDPFEPQPDGVDTIFPFWVPGKNGRGYVELPYTLVQDFNLFVVLKEPSIDIWKKKLAWIVARGGMALLIVHPDYTNFSGRRAAPDEFPVERYREFLQHVKETYAGQYWNALPREVAAWYRKTHVAPADRAQPESHPGRMLPGAEIVRENALAGKRVAVVLYSYYANDPRPRRESESLHRAGAAVDVICLRKDSREPRDEILNGVHIHRIGMKRRRAGKLTYVFQYFSFLLISLLALTWWRLKRRYDLVHVHNMPDILVFSALLPKILGARVILDLHDPMPELFRSIYDLPERHFAVRWLEKMERRSIAFADLVFTPNLAFKELFASRSCVPGKIEIVMNSPETAIFDPRKYPHVNGQPVAVKPFVLMYHGLIVERHGLDLAIRAVAQLRERIPSLRLHLYGESTDYFEKMKELVKELNLEGVVHAHGFKPLTEIARDISGIDLGLIPNRISSFTQINFPTRIFEYLAMNKPVMVPSTQGIRDYFNDDEILFFEAGSVDRLADQIEWAYRHPAELAQKLQMGRAVYEKHNWNAQEKHFIRDVAQLIAHE